MTPGRRLKSEYMEWVKTGGHARYNLASSDLLPVRIDGLSFTPGDLELTGPGGYGYRPLTEAVAERYEVDPGRVVTTAGTSMANHLALAALLEPGDEVLIEQPTYELIVSAAEFLGAKVIRFPRRFESGFQIDPEDIIRAAGARTRLIVLTNLHNPSSAFTDEATLSRIGEIARRTGARVLVDEVYLDAAFDLRPRTSHHLGREFVVTNSLTKVYGLSGLRCGWILAETAVAEKIWRLADLFYSSLPHVAERLSVIAFSQLPALERRARGILEANAAAVNRFFRVRGDLESLEHARGLVALPRLKAGDSSGFCDRLLANYETSVVPGRFFDLPRHLRIGLGGEPADVEEGLRRLAGALDEEGKR
ncbi:MAG TPA: pyridoxal phosphate-dependent aminotransferase [Bacteroidota bacterium]|jgi:aspartate/methionine/tyrosine aminotransferase